MSAKPITYKKRNNPGQCRAMRCKCAEPDHKLYEHETGDPKVGTALLCEWHWRRASENAADPAPVGPAAPDTAAGAPVAPPVIDATAPPSPPTAPAVDIGGGLTATNVLETPAEPVAQTAVVVAHAPVLALVEPLRAEYTGMAGQLQALEIVSQEQVDMAAELLKQVKGKLNTLEKQRKDITKPMLDAKKAVDALFKPATDAAKHVEGMLKAGIAGFIEAAQAAKLAALESGDHATALAVAQPELPAGVSTRTTWRFNVVDQNLIPREYWAIDLSKIQTHVNTYKGQSAIPGVQVYCDTGVSARGTA